MHVRQIMSIRRSTALFTATSKVCWMEFPNSNEREKSLFQLASYTWTGYIYFLHHQVCVVQEETNLVTFSQIPVCVHECESVLSHNCGSILPAQSPIRAPLIQHTHCTFSGSMIPLCLSGTHYFLFFTSTTYAQNLCTHTNTQTSHPFFLPS